MPTYKISAPISPQKKDDGWSDLAKAFLNQPGFAGDFMQGNIPLPPLGGFGPEAASTAETFAAETPGAFTGPVAAAPQSDRDLIAGVLAAEGRGMQDMMYVADVIANRVASPQFANDWRGVILQPGQFSALNAVTGYAGGAGANDVWKNPSTDAYRIADDILAGTFQGGLTSGALNYYEPNYASPAWGGPGFVRLPGSTHVFGTAR